MSYAAEFALATDPPYQNRVRACTTQQAGVFKDDARGDIAALARGLLRNEGGPLLTFFNLTASAPGFADTADDGEGGIDSSAIPDADILSAVQAQWPTVAALYYDAEGNPIGET